MHTSVCCVLLTQRARSAAQQCGTAIAARSLPFLAHLVACSSCLPWLHSTSEHPLDPIPCQAAWPVNTTAKHRVYRLIIIVLDQAAVYGTTGTTTGHQRDTKAHVLQSLPFNDLLHCTLLPSTCCSAMSTSTTTCSCCCEHSPSHIRSLPKYHVLADHYSISRSIDACAQPLLINHYTYAS